MNCINGIDDFFSKEAEKFLKRFKKRGLEKSQKNLVEGLLVAGVIDKTILEIGCGVGYLHSRLLLQGAKNATGVDISEEMLRCAKEYMKEIGLDKKTKYHRGDFVEISEKIGKVDITILDKVICCYPQVESLVEKSIQKTGKTYAFTLPRNKWWVKYPAFAVIRLLKLFRSNFHPYIHEHEIINRLLINSGFQKVYQNHTFIWETCVFEMS
jgi:magnesium-protoporphyrin O-methyltransferase